jgi:hypothetical protein
MGLSEDEMPVPAAHGRWQLLVRSLGTGGAAVLPVLRQLRAGSDRELAAVLYRAPAVLLDDVDEERGRTLCELLEKTGIEVELLRKGEGFEPGKGEFEVALAIRSLDQILEIIEETVRVLGVDVEAARKLIAASPAVLIGGVSSATVASLQQRFGSLGVELDVSRSADAMFDMAVEVADGGTRAAIHARLRAAGAHVTATAPDQLIATGLTKKSADELWSEFARTAAKVRVLNCDLQRFDVRLDHAPDTPAVHRWLVEATGMPARLVGKALQNLPLILAENVRGQDMVALLRGAHECEARATATLLALQSFSLRLSPGGDRTSVVPWVQAVGGRAAAASFARPRVELLEGPFTKLQARWLQHELRRHKVVSQLVER